MNKNKQKTKGIKQCIEYDPLYVNFEKDTHIFTFSIQTGIIFFLEGYTRKNKFTVALSGEKDMGETSVYHFTGFYTV